MKLHLDKKGEAGQTLKFAEARGDPSHFSKPSTSHSAFFGTFAFFFAGVVLLGRSGIGLGSSSDGVPKRLGAVTLRRGRTGVNGGSNSSESSDESGEEDGTSVLMGSAFVSGSAGAESAVDIMWFGLG